MIALIISRSHLGDNFYSCEGYKPTISGGGCGGKLRLYRIQVCHVSHLNKSKTVGSSILCVTACRSNGAKCPTGGVKSTPSGPTAYERLAQ